MNILNKENKLSLTKQICHSVSYNNRISFKNNENFSELGTNTVYTNWNNPKLSAEESKDDVNLSLIHINDTHGQTEPLMRISSAINKITEKIKKTKDDFIKIHSGDFSMGFDSRTQDFLADLLDYLKINFLVLGNHEFDTGSKNLAENLNKTKFKILGSNLIIPKNSVLDKLNNIAETKIFNTNSHKYGIIGICPPDLKKRLSSNSPLYGINVLSETKTIAKIKKDIDELKQKNINKIILVSHAGYKFDRKIAKSIDGIDIILGGHSHDLLNPLIPKSTIINSPCGDPVLIFHEGKNGDFFGVINTKFNKDGIIKSAKAGQENSNDFKIDKEALKLEKEILGESPKIGYLADNYSDDKIKIQENPIGNFIADSMRSETNADIAFFTSFSLRDNFKKGNITKRDIEESLPSSRGISVIRITGQDIIDALTHGAKTCVRKEERPGILQVSGLKYTISPKGEAINVKILINDSYEAINPEKEYNVALDNLLIEGLENFSTLTKPDKIVKKTDYKYADIVIKAIQKKNTPITMQTEGRIEIQTEEPALNFL